MKSLTREDLDRLCSPEYLDALADAPVGELRERRDSCQAAEVVISYLRRVIQGELDLAGAELTLRSEAGTSDVGRLVEELPHILASNGVPAEPNHTLVPALDSLDEAMEVSEGLALAELLGDGEDAGELSPSELLPGANVCTFDDDELRALVERLRSEEARLSARRRVLHEQIDAIQAVIVERYKTGTADPDSLLD